MTGSVLISHLHSYRYWDWTINNSGLPRAALYDRIAVAHGGPGGTVSLKKVPNPLLKYTFQDVELHKRHFIDGRPDDPNVSIDYSASSVPRQV